MKIGFSITTAAFPRMGRVGLSGLLILGAVVTIQAYSAEDAGTPSVAVNYGLHQDPACATLPAFDYRITNGLYATITALSFEEPKLKSDSKVKLNKIEGFQRDLEVRALWQKEPAPLVVLLLGW